MASCKFPFLVKNPSVMAGFSDYAQIPVPCGKCYDCKMTIVSQWAFRIQQEEKYSNTSKFVTLTYKDAPITKNKFMTLVKSDLQKFFKRLRFYHKKFKIDLGQIKYFAVGEYGSLRGRPHYHIILLNSTDEMIEKAWPNAIVHIGNVTGRSIAYTLKYIMKKSVIPIHKRDDRLKEFRLMSKKLGSQYLKEDTVSFYKNSKKTYITMEDKYKIPLPRYYKNKIFNEEELKKINLDYKKTLQNIEMKKENEFEKIKKRTNHANYKDYERAAADYKRERAEKRNNRDQD